MIRPSLALAFGFFALPASAAVVKLDVTVRSVGGNDFSSPIFTFTNQSTPGFGISSVAINGGHPWDFVYLGPVGTDYEILDPAGGTRTLTVGQESSIDPNDGCTASIGYNLTSFDSGDFFRFAPDPEAGGCGSAVIHIGPTLENNAIGIGVGFANGINLTGSDWTLEYVDGNPGNQSESNRIYQLTLSSNVAGVPEPAEWSLMIAGFALAGAQLRKKRPCATVWFNS